MQLLFFFAVHARRSTVELDMWLKLYEVLCAALLMCCWKCQFPLRRHPKEINNLKSIFLCHQFLLVSLVIKLKLGVCRPSNGNMPPFNPFEMSKTFLYLGQSWSEWKAAEKLIKGRFFLGISVSLLPWTSESTERRSLPETSRTRSTSPSRLKASVSQWRPNRKMKECSSLLGCFSQVLSLSNIYKHSFKLYMQLTSTDLWHSAAGWVSDYGSQSTKWILECVTTPEWVIGPPGQSFWLSESAPTPMAELEDCRPSFQVSNSQIARSMCLFMFLKVNYYLKAENIISFKLDVWGREKERGNRQ